MRIDAFQPAAHFKAKMDEWITTFRNTKPSEGNDQVIIPGDPERQSEEMLLKHGICLMPQVVSELKDIAQKMDVPVLSD